MINLGRFELCLNVKDINQSIDFYKKLGFEIVARDSASIWATVKYGNTMVALYRGCISKNILNFRGSDVFAVANALKESGLKFKRGPEIEEDGSAGAVIEDPDGNVIYFNTHPDEKE